MSLLGPVSLLRAAGAFAFVWTMAPHQPDLGLGRPQTIGALVADTAASCGGRDANCGHEVLGKLPGPDTLEQSRGIVLDTIERVRTDLAQNRRH